MLIMTMREGEGEYRKLFICILRFPPFSHRGRFLQSNPITRSHIPHAPPPSLSSHPTINHTPHYPYLLPAKPSPQPPNHSLPILPLLPTQPSPPFKNLQPTL